MEKSEKKKHSFIQAINTIRNEKVKKKKEGNIRRRVEKAKVTARIEKKIEDGRKVIKKRRYRTEGKIEAHREKKRLRGN